MSALPSDNAHAAVVLAYLKMVMDIGDNACATMG